MGLNKQSGNMYNFITHTSNPLGGRCPHDCGYCSSNGYRERNLEAFINKYSGNPRLIKSELTNFGSGKVIFVCSQNDLFAADVNWFIIEIILYHCCLYDNKYLFQTKNPERILEFKDSLPPNSVICTTIETNRVYPDIMNNCPDPIDRAIALNELANHFKTMVTIEPILDFDFEELVAFLKISRPFQINIGADSGGNKLQEPSKVKISRLIELIPTFTNIHLKGNIKRVLLPNYNQKYE